MSEPLTEAQLVVELGRLKFDDVDTIADLYRRALLSGVAFRGLARSLLNLVEDSDAFRARLAAIHHEIHGGKLGYG